MLEVMYQHQHAPLPLELLEGAPQPVVTLLEVFLEKDPARRFQNPAELLKAIPAITDALEARRRITRQRLQKTPSTASRVGTRKPPTRLTSKKISILIVEKSAQLARRVGEATVEVSAFFMGRVLGLTQYLNESHLVKQGLRFWFTNDEVKSLDEASELDGHYQVRLPSYQLDRAVFD